MLYYYDSDSKAYTTSFAVDWPAGDPLPPCSTRKQPPATTQNQTAVYNVATDAWTISVNYRGITLYNTLTRESRNDWGVGDTPGPDWTMKQPPDLSNLKYTDGEWVEDIAAKQRSVDIEQAVVLEKRLAALDRKSIVFLRRILLNLAKGKSPSATDTDIVTLGKLEKESELLEQEFDGLDI